MKISIANFFFFITIILVHFDPIGVKITFAFFYLFGILMSFRATLNTYKYAFFSLSLFAIAIYNFFVFKDVEISDFIKTFLLLLFSVFFHIFFSTCSRYKNFNINAKGINYAMGAVFSLAVLQFITFVLFNLTSFFNIFGMFSYANQYDLQKLYTSSLPRVTSFYLEPSYLAFVIINLYLFLFLLKKNNVKHLILVFLTLFFAGSRGGYIFFALFLLCISFVSPLISKKRKVMLFFVTCSFMAFIGLMTDSFSILSGDSIVTENTSQYERIYLGYKLGEQVLLNLPTGIPLGQLEIYFQKLIGIDSSIFSFFFLAIAYFGFAGIALLLSIFILIFINFKFKQFSFLTIYLLMYFNLTGSLLAPDTYFWFSIFILLFRNSNKIWVNELK